jgi:hypothetical protein
MAVGHIPDTAGNDAEGGRTRCGRSGVELEGRGWAAPFRDAVHRAPASAARVHIAGFAPFVSHPISEPCFMASTCSGVGGCGSLLLRQSGEHLVFAG